MKATDIVQIFRNFADWHNGINTFIYGMSDRQLSAELSKTQYRYLHIDYVDAQRPTVTNKGFTTTYNVDIAILDQTRPDDFHREHDILSEVECIILDLIGVLLHGYDDGTGTTKYLVDENRITIGQYFPVERYRGNDNTWGYVLQLQIQSYFCYDYTQNMTIKPYAGQVSFEYSSDGTNVNFSDTSNFGVTKKWLYRLNNENELQESLTPPTLPITQDDNWIVILEVDDGTGYKMWARATIEKNPKPYSGKSYPYSMTQLDNTIAQLNPDSNH